VAPSSVRSVLHGEVCLPEFEEGMLPIPVLATMPPRDGDMLGIVGSGRCNLPSDFSVVGVGSIAGGAEVTSRAGVSSSSESTVRSMKRGDGCLCRGEISSGSSSVSSIMEPVSAEVFAFDFLIEPPDSDDVSSRTELSPLSES